MDKTRNKIFVGCLALLLVMVVGYALFSQNLTISGTAKAEGDFSVTPTCQTGIPSNLVASVKSFFTKNDVAWVDENAYYDDSCTVSGNTINYQSSFKYPGARRYFTVKVTNTGSITAIEPIADQVNGSISVTEVCLDNNNNDIIDSDECYTDSTSKEIGEKMFDLDDDVDFQQPFAIENKDGSITTIDDMLNMTEEELMSKYYVLGEDGVNYEFKLEPGESAYFLLTLGLDSRYGSNEGGKFMARVKASGTSTFKQPKA